MRVAAGVILIFVALIDLFAGVGYLGWGAAGVGANKLENAMEESMKEKNKGELTDEDRKKLEEFNSGAKKLQNAGGGLLFFGIFLLVSVGTSFTAAIFLFMQKSPTFIIVASTMAILGEVAGILIIKFGVTNVFGLVGGLFGILAARQIMDANRAPPTGVSAV